MPFIEIITDAKSQSQLSKAISKRTVKNADILYVKEKFRKYKKYKAGNTCNKQKNRKH